MRNNNKKKNLLSLTYREITSNNKFFITSYDDQFVRINEIKFDLPLCLLGKNCYQINLISIDEITNDLFKLLIKKYREINLQNPELIILGLNKFIKHQSLLYKKLIGKTEISCEIMRYDAACRTLNILNSENRNTITLLI